jgi:hypothetical protein
MKVKLVFLHWQQKGRSIYNTERGNDLSMGDFHSGTTFEGEIELDEEQEVELFKAIQAGFQPCFWIAKDEG